MTTKSEVEELRKIYLEGKLIPFIGTGLSYPFSVPDWAALIRNIAKKHLEPAMVEIINTHLGRYEYWNAVDFLKNYSSLSDFQLQEEICQELKDCVNVKIDDKLHNYKDLADMNFNTFFTTNYDLLISKYINNPKCIPQVLNRVQVNSQKIFEKRDYPQLWHLHGHVEDTGSIVISKDVYDRLYDDEKYKNLFTVVQGVGTFLFIGFSFNDVYIQDLLSRNNKALNTTHYILLESPTDEIKRNFANKFNIKVIGYKAISGDHASAIREILSQVAAVETSNKSNINIFVPESIDDLMIPSELPTTKEKIAFETSLFCKKLRIENICDELTEFSKDCFFFSDKLLRALKKRKFPKEEIKKVLADVYMSYSAGRKNIYSNTKNSHLFLEYLMKELENKDFKIINNKLEFNPFQKQGFIHNLADDEKYSVWWGDNINV